MGLRVRLVNGETDTYEDIDAFPVQVSWDHEITPDRSLRIIRLRREDNSGEVFGQPRYGSWTRSEWAHYEPGTFITVRHF